MVNLDKGLLKIIKDESLEDYFIKANFGLEKENVRVTESGNLALTPHPKAFGDREKNPYIKTDFSESQLEMVTPVCNTLEEVYSFICNLNKVVSLEIMKNGEFLWPQSNPPILPMEEEIPIAKLSNREDELYRENLSYKYGKKKQVISGIHYNFSFKEEFIKLLYKELKVEKDFREFKDDIYLRMARNFQKYHWLLIYLTGASPVFHESYIDEIKKDGEILGEDSYYIKDDTSLRNSSYGYKNKKDYYVSYNSIGEYASDIKNLVKDKEIQSIKEYYDPETKSGTGFTGRKVKGTIHWVDANNCIPAEFRLYEPLILDDCEENEGKHFLEQINPNSLTICKGFIEPSAKDAKPQDKYQLFRHGYFNVDPNFTSDDNLVFNRIVSLKSSFKLK